jgi:AcrR family transcriptional regulator
VARPKEFDRDKALDTAIHLFRRNGYAATTTDDLRLAMGIGRQSFYDTFKGKREIYGEALLKYSSDRSTEFFDIAKKNKSPLKSIESILHSFTAEDKSEKSLACLGVSSICEFGTSDKQIALINKNAGITVLSFLEKLLIEAKDKGEVRKSLNPGAVAEYLLTVITGIKVAVRSEAPSKKIEQTIQVVMDSLS